MAVENWQVFRQSDALLATAERVLACFLFEFRFYFNSHNQFVLPECPALLGCKLVMCSFLFFSQFVVACAFIFCH
jgi:hypothetical protein